MRLHYFIVLDKEAQRLNRELALEDEHYDEYYIVSESELMGNFYLHEYEDGREDWRRIIFEYEKVGIFFTDDYSLEDAVNAVKFLNVSMALIGDYFDY